MSEEVKEEAIKPKFLPGQIVKHPLGLKCMVSSMYDAQKAEDGSEKKLPFILYDLQFVDKTGNIQTTRIAEPFIQEA